LIHPLRKHRLRVESYNIAILVGTSIAVTHGEDSRVIPEVEYVKGGPVSADFRRIGDDSPKSD
jgi:hypothetical protein